MSYIVYLAGPITGLEYKKAIGWREAFIKLVPDEIQCMSPLRGKFYLEKFKGPIGNSYENIVLSSARGITTRDYNDCRRADLLVVNFLAAEKISIGTCMEVAWAKAFQIPVIMVIETEGNVHDHAMIKECVGFRVTTLEEAANLVKIVLLPVPH